MAGTGDATDPCHLRVPPSLASRRTVQACNGIRAHSRRSVIGPAVPTAAGRCHPPCLAHIRQFGARLRRSRGWAVADQNGGSARVLSERFITQRETVSPWSDTSRRLDVRGWSGPPSARRTSMPRSSGRATLSAREIRLDAHRAPLGIPGERPVTAQG